jgi:hypothetical protein
MACLRFAHPRWTRGLASACRWRNRHGGARLQDRCSASRRHFAVGQFVVQRQLRCRHLRLSLLPRGCPHRPDCPCGGLGIRAARAVLVLPARRLGSDAEDEHRGLDGSCGHGCPCVALWRVPLPGRSGDGHGRRRAACHQTAPVGGSRRAAFRRRPVCEPAVGAVRRRVACRRLPRPPGHAPPFGGLCGCTRTFPGLAPRHDDRLRAALGRDRLAGLTGQDRRHRPRWCAADVPLTRPRQARQVDGLSGGGGGLRARLAST